MARPVKFRLTPDDVLEPGNARKLAGHVSEIEFFRAEVEKLQAQIAGVYDAADDDGFDKKFIRKAVARRAKDSDELASEEAAVDAYTFAVAKGLATRTREKNPETDLPEHDATTGEVLETDEQFSAGVQIMRDRAADHAPVGQLEIISNEGAAATETAPDYLREPPAVVSGQIIREGDAPLEADTRALVVGEVREGEHLDTELPETATETLDDLAVQDGVKMSSDGGGDLTAGLTPTWPLNPADDGQIASNSHADLTAKSGEGAASSSAPLAHLKTTDEVADDMGLPGEAHPGCRKPKTCGRFSHTGLCADCRGEDREAA